VTLSPPGYKVNKKYRHIHSFALWTSFLSNPI
jgi:hypothetical protein